MIPSSEQLICDNFSEFNLLPGFQQVLLLYILEKRIELEPRSVDGGKTNAGAIIYPFILH